MRGKRSSLALINPFVLALALFLSLLPGAWAKAKFKVLANVPGGLWTGLTLDAKGNLYGVTSGGGDYGEGSVFEVARGAHGKWTVTTLHSFDGKDGASPNGNLIFDTAGNLYGTSPAGGAYYRGLVFQLSPGPDGWTFTDIYDFCSQENCPEGYGPLDGLILDKAGNLYGNANGGPDCCGVAYELTPGSGGWTYSVLYDFGSKPNDSTASTAPMIFGKEGDLYGTGNRGGLYGGGTVFRLRKHSGAWRETLLHCFCEDGFPCQDGFEPQGGVAFGLDGAFYGTTTGGGSPSCPPYNSNCGTIFSLELTTDGRWKHRVLYDFAKPEDGFAPGAGVTPDKRGNLYGTTALGGTGGCNYGCGVVFELSPRAGCKWAYTVLHKFSDGDGSLPDGGVVRDKLGNLYGVAYSTVFEITP